MLGYVGVGVGVGVVYVEVFVVVPEVLGQLLAVLAHQPLPP